MSALTPCRACQRHILVSEPACPFCAERQRTRRGAAVAAVIGASLALTACPQQRQAALYGGPPEPPPIEPTTAPTTPPAPEPTTAPTTAPQPAPQPTATVAPPDDDGGMRALYGAPPEPDDSRMAPEYGAPPPPDAEH